MLQYDTSSNTETPTMMSNSLLLTSQLSAAFLNALALLETSSKTTSSQNIEGTLKNRLVAYYNQRNDQNALQTLDKITSREEIELLTGREALSVLQRLQKIMDVQYDESTQGSPLISTKDLAKLGTLLSLTFKWGIERLYTQVVQSGSFREKSRPVTVDTSVIDYDYHLLSDLVSSLLLLVFPEGAQGRISQTLITTTILAKHVTDLVLPSIALGWLPVNVSTSSMPVVHAFRPFVTRLLGLLPPSQTIPALGSIISRSPTPPPHVRKACTLFLTKQLLRPDGVQGLCIAFFSEEETTGDMAQLDKLEQFARILNSVPSALKAEEYYGEMFPRVLHVLTKSTQTSHRRAAAFAVYRGLVPEKVTQTSAKASSSILALLHASFLELPLWKEGRTGQPTSNLKETLEVIVTLLANAGPSPIFISKLLSPLIATLYGLSYDISQHRTVDPQLKGSVSGLLKSWAKIVNQMEGQDILWSVIDGGKECDWKFDMAGNFWKIQMREQNPPGLLMPHGSKDAKDTEEHNSDLNIFDFYPDPVHFVETVKTFDRGDISSSLFVKLLEHYRDMKGQSEQDPMNVLHKLQIIMQMQKRLSEGTTSSILRKPDKLLPFIRHVLASANTTAYFNTGESAEIQEGDSDDEEQGSNIIGPDDELIETTITLLLSILESDESLSVTTYPILNEIFSLLEPLASKGTILSLRPLAREARLVMTARLAETSSTPRSASKTEDVNEIYQRALKLLQDPILPVRAHGLLLLRELLGSTYAKDQVTKAFLPSILSIFLQSVQDEDSYIFLNAVQGLAMLVDKFGREILQGLVRDYTGQMEGLSAGNMEQHDIDVRTRIGEALGSVIKRCGSALGLYLDLLVPPLFAVVRNADVPTVLRTSSISLLAECVDTCPLPVLPYVQDLCFGFIDLLQLESVPAKMTERDTTALDEEVQPPLTMDPDPTSTNTKLPPLRRAALHFLTLLIRASTKLIYDEGSAKTIVVFPRSATQRASTTLGYISSTDDDNLVRIMAREAKESLDMLQQAILGL